MKPSARRTEESEPDGPIRVRVVDWEQPANNDFLLVSQFSVTGALYTCRPDLVGFVNGLPLVFIELKKPGGGKCRMPNFDGRTAASSSVELIEVRTSGYELRTSGYESP